MPNDPTWDDTSDVSEPIWEDTKEVPQPAIKLSPYEQYRLKGGETVAGPFGPASPEEVPALLSASQRPFIPLPDTQAKGPLAAAYRSVIKPVVEGIESPMGVLMAPALAQSVPLRIAAGVGFGGMAAKSGLEKMQSEDPQTQLEGRMELAGAPLLALSGGVRDKVAPTPEIASPRAIPAVPEALPKAPEIVPKEPPVVAQGESPTAPAVSGGAAIPDFAKRYDPETLLQRPAWVEPGSAFDKVLGDLREGNDPLKDKDVTGIWKSLTPEQKQDLAARGWVTAPTRQYGQVTMHISNDAAAAKRFYGMQNRLAQKVVPSGVSGEPPSEAPSTVKAQVAGGATPSTEPAKVEATPTPPSPQASIVTTPVTEKPTAEMTPREYLAQSTSEQDPMSALKQHYSDMMKAYRERKPINMEAAEKYEPDVEGVKNFAEWLYQRSYRPNLKTLNWEYFGPEEIAKAAQQFPIGGEIGPGAASVGDIPRQSQLSQLSGQIQAQQGRISPNTPISDRIANAVNLGERWAKAKDSATQGLAKTRAASQALINAYVNQPKWTDFISSIGRWVGADQKTALEVRDFQKAIVKAVPNRLRQEAITNWIQANGDEALLRQRAEASKPSVRRGYEVALELNDAEKNLARNIQSYLESRLEEGLKAGLLKQGVENYVTQVWKRPTSQTQKMWADLFGIGTLNPNFKYAKQRIFDSYFEGEQAGFIPKNKTIGNLVSIYDLAFNRALSARGLIKELQIGKAEDGMPITMTSGKTSPVSGDSNIPEAFLIKPNTPPTGAVTADGRPYRPIDHWALRDWKWATKGPQGQPVFVQGDMLVHPDHWNHLNNVLKHSRLQSNPITGTILRAAGIAKQTKLSLSPFHTIQEGVHAASHRVNPFAPTELDLNVPEQKALVDHGLMVQDPRAQELFAEGASGGGLVGKIPGLGNLQQWYTEVTFKDYIPNLKMNMALDALERNRKAYAGKLNDDQILALTARESNAAFGEQNYRLMGRSPNVQDFMRLALLAPDFLESRARFIGQALKPYGREQRIALGLMAGVLYTAARVINKATDDDYHWDKPFSVFANGKEYRLRTLLGDAQHLLTDPRSFWYNRLSPISRTLSEYVTGRDDRGIKRSSMEQLADFASWFKPIPLQVRPEESVTQAVLASAGVPSKMHTKGQELFEIADKWMANNPDRRIQEHYKRVRQETLPESPYRPLRDALRAGNIKGARDVYQKLLPTHAQKIISETLNPNKPLTGLSKANEVKFVNSLDASQRKVYDAARAEKRNIWQNYQRMLKGE